MHQMPRLLCVAWPAAPPRQKILGRCRPAACRAAVQQATRLFQFMESPKVVPGLPRQGTATVIVDSMYGFGCCFEGSRIWLKGACRDTLIARVYRGPVDNNYRYLLRVL